jgi:amidohydrolase
MSAFWQNTMHHAVSFRRALHSEPELSWQETRTAQKIRNALSELKIPWSPCAGTGTLARLNKTGGRTSTPHIALRGDIDALPIQEQSGKHWASQQAGCMHACGHDGHTATLMAAARYLKHVEDQLPGPVTLIFQPAEEGGHGALRMIEAGALDGIDEIYGWHNWPAIEQGKMVCPSGIVMCGNGTFEITVTGLGGHASQPELCRDPVLAASAIHLNLQQVVARRLPPQQAAVLSVTSIQAPSAATVIPSQAVLGGSIRVPDQNTRDTINQLIHEIAHSTAQTYGVSAKVNIQPRYHATINHSEQAARMRNEWVALHGNTGSLCTNTPVPIMASEDFSYYLREIPGAFALIGAGIPGEQAYPCHSPFYDFNDNLIEPVSRLYSRLVGAPDPTEQQGELR